MTVRRSTFAVIFVIVYTVLISALFDNAAVYWCAVLVLLAICLWLGLKETKKINPYILFAVTPFTLLIYSNISDKYMVDLEKSTWLIALLNIAAFVAAMVAAPKCISRPKMTSRNLDSRQIHTDAVLLAILGFAPAILFSVMEIAVPLYSIFSLLTVAALMCAVKLKNIKLLVIFLALYGLTWMNNVTKSSILTTCLALLIGYEHYFVKTKKQRRKFFVLCGLALLIVLFSFTFANQLRGTKTAESQLAYYTKYGDVSWNGNAAFFMPYMYLETPWANLQYVMQTQNVRTNGLWLIKPLINYVQIDKWFASEYVLVPMSSFNTYTYIACQFKDFGLIGSAFSSILLGIFVKFVYSRYKISQDPLDAACYVYTAQAVLEMFFSNHFFQQSYPITIVLLIALYRTAMNRMRRHKMVKYQTSKQGG